MQVRVFADAHGVVAGVLVLHFDGLGEHGDGGVEQLALLAEELGAFDAGGDVGGEGVGQLHVVLG